MRKTCIALGSALACTLSVSVHAEPIYDLTIIEPSSFGQYTFAWDVNDSGVVVGETDGQAFIWDAATGLTTLGPPASSSSWAVDINNDNQVLIGTSGADYVWSATSGYTEVPGTTQADTGVIAMSDSGYLAGASGGAASRWDLATFNVEPLGGTGSVAFAINDSGTMAGSSGGAPALFDENGTTLLGDATLQGHAEDITDSGAVTGWIYDPVNIYQSSFVWTEQSGLLQLARPDGYDLDEAYAINESLQVVGQMQGMTDASAYIWDTTNGMRNLNDLIDPAENFHLFAAMGINESGQIVGIGWNGSGIETAFLLTPTTFQPLPGEVETVPLLPDEQLSDGGFLFRLPDIEEEETVWIDPEIAIGYTYSVENAEFFSITAPSFATIADLDGYVLEIAGVLYDLGSGQEFFFDSGITEFVLRGIDVSLSLDPANAQAFPLGVSFTNIVGPVAVTQVPITEFVDGPGTSVPEPSVLTMLGMGLGFIGYAGVCRRRSSVV